MSTLGSENPISGHYITASVPGDIWHLDEVFVTISGERHYLWRAVDQDGAKIDILVQRHRNARAAKRFFRNQPANESV